MRCRRCRVFEITSIQLLGPIAQYGTFAEKILQHLDSTVANTQSKITGYLMISPFWITRVVSLDNFWFIFQKIHQSYIHAFPLCYLYNNQCVLKINQANDLAHLLYPYLTQLAQNLLCLRRSCYHFNKSFLLFSIIT